MEFVIFMVIFFEENELIVMFFCFFVMVINDYVGGEGFVSRFRLVRRL